MIFRKWSSRGLYVLDNKTVYLEFRGQMVAWCYPLFAGSERAKAGVRPRVYYGRFIGYTVPDDSEIAVEPVTRAEAGIHDFRPPMLYEYEPVETTEVVERPQQKYRNINDPWEPDW